MRAPPKHTCDTELFNMLINPETHDFALRWHRDDIRETASEEEECNALGKWNGGVGAIYYLTTLQN